MLPWRHRAAPQLFFCLRNRWKSPEGPSPLQNPSLLPSPRLASHSFPSFSPNPRSRNARFSSVNECLPTAPPFLRRRPPTSHLSPCLHGHPGVDSRYIRGSFRCPAGPVLTPWLTRTRRPLALLPSPPPRVPPPPRSRALLPPPGHRGPRNTALAATVGPRLQDLRLSSIHNTAARRRDPRRYSIHTRGSQIGAPGFDHELAGVVAFLLKLCLRCSTKCVRQAACSALPYGESKGSYIPHGEIVSHCMLLIQGARHQRQMVFYFFLNNNLCFLIAALLTHVFRPAFGVFRPAFGYAYNNTPVLPYYFWKLQFHPMAQRKCSQKTNLAKARLKRQYISSASYLYSSEPHSADMIVFWPCLCCADTILASLC